MLPTADLDYHLPPELIAMHPARPRDSARLMVVSRVREREGGGEGAPPLLPEPPQHRTVRDLPDLLRAGDLLVLNSTRVIPARFRGHREDSSGKVDGLYLGPPRARDGSSAGARLWTVLIKSRRAARGVGVRLHDRDDRPTDVSLRLLERDPQDPAGAAWVAEVIGSDRSAPELLELIGLTPLPPYIRQARRVAHDPGDDAIDRADYQTVFAQDGPGPSGSVAAPTAGLHFTPELLSALRARGIQTAEVMLHVGPGTFKPVETELVEQHPMHAEWCQVPPASGAAIVEARRSGRRIIAVGTTGARTLESFPEADQLASGPSGWTRLLITPGHRWRWVDGLLTNFHLPRSTLLALVGAMLGDDRAAITRLKSLYEDAVERGYRFYSFGDAMLIL